MEWQLVVRLFNIMGEKITTEFDHPKPGNNGKIEFCEYWKESWSFRGEQVMDGPVPVTLSPASPSSVSGPIPSTDPISVSGAIQQAIQRTPFKWLASQYPYRHAGDGWLDELTLLERKTNSESKGRVMFDRSMK
jgi:hypothetical protein